MSDRICGHCTNWRCDEPLHLKGHCIINRMDRFHGTVCDTCTKFQGKPYKENQVEFKIINRGKCMLCGKELTEGLFFCKECEAKGRAEE